MVDYAGGIYQFVPNEVPATNAFSAAVERDRTFRRVAGHVPAAGVIPYSVNSPLWSDAEKGTLIACPAAQIQFTDRAVELSEARWR